MDWTGLDWKNWLVLKIPRLGVGCDGWIYVDDE
jgi:hypothetical protein